MTRVTPGWGASPEQTPNLADGIYRQLFCSDQFPDKQKVVKNIFMYYLPHYIYIAPHTCLLELVV